MNFFDILLWPLRWVIELVLVAGHALVTSLGMPFNSGWSWVLAILVLVLIVRSAMIPLMLRQIKSMRGMMEMQPEMQRIRDKYKGKRDQFSQQAQQQEIMALYKRHGSSPMSSCWPMLVQMPIFFALLQVLQAANRNEAGVGLMSRELAMSFSGSEIFGAPMSAVLANANGNMNIIIVAVVLIILMLSMQFFTQFQITAQNVSQAAKESPMYRQQQIMMYVLPLVFAISGVMFPIGLMVYWFLTNLWTTGQQWWTIRNMPTPGSTAAKKREDRLRAAGKWDDHPDNPANKKKKIDTETGKPIVQTGQRQQPMSKQRAKKKKGKR